MLKKTQQFILVAGICVTFISVALSQSSSTAEGSQKEGSLVTRHDGAQTN